MLNFHKGPFHASINSEESWSKGLRPYLEYRDLGIEKATGGNVQAHVIRAVEPCPGPLGYHYHDLQFQMVYVLRGSIRSRFEGVGEITFNAHDCWYQQPGIRHEVTDYSDDFMVLEINIPGNFATVNVDPASGAQTVYEDGGGNGGAEPSGPTLHKGPFHAAIHSEESWSKGLRPYLEYRELGIEKATKGQVQAHAIRAIKPCKGPLGYHYHDLEFQMNYLLRGSTRVEFEGVGEIEFNAHDSWYQKPGIQHEVLHYSDDFTVLEMNIPAEFPTIDVDRKTGAESVYG